MHSCPPEELLGPLNDVERRFAPRLFWYEGDGSLLRRGARVSIVGTREVSEPGRQRTRRLVRFLVERSVTVVSGLAAGVDTAAHTATLALGGRTIAVIGTGLDTAYPSENRALQERIAREHLLVSQFEPGTPVRKGQFPQRNRTMALVSHATIIIEAGDGSGTLSQAWEALRLGRPLFILRSLADDPKLKWPAEVLAYGAIVLAEPEQLLPALPEGDDALADILF
ncbi:MAG: DNA-processing protein DprA [Myxococcaceae bacterium]|nr:MAG: DNA-processing protein DprA [Myxococcaceae bacterium]